MTKFENPRGFEYILVVLDCFTKRAWAFAMKTRSAESVMEHLGPLLEKEKFEIIQTDNGGEFRNHQLAEFAKSHDLIHKTSAPYCPNQNGQVERTNQTFKAKLFSLCGDDIDNWDLYLEEALQHYNEATHSTTKVCFIVLIILVFPLFC